MWSLAGDALTGSYGHWNDRIYELVGDAGDEVTLVMSAEAEPAPGWSRRDPHANWGEGCRWQLRVPRDEVSGCRYVRVETPIYGTAGGGAGVLAGAK